MGNRSNEHGLGSMLSWSEIAHELSQEPHREDGPEREVFLARLAMRGDSEIVKQWYGWRKPEGLDVLSPAERLLYVQIESTKTEREIDQVLEAGGTWAARSGGNSPTAALDRMLSESVAEDLARLYIPWSNPALIQMLDGRVNSRQAAAWLLAWADDAELAEWFEECEDDQHALEAGRVVGLLGNTMYWDRLVAWLELAESEGDTEAKAGFHAALACMNPVRYARSVVLGDMEVDWIQDARHVADFLQTHGVTDWLETLALFEEAKNTKGSGEGEEEGYEFAALVALGASAAGVLEEDVDVEQLFEWLDLVRDEDTARAAERLMASGHFGFQVALGEDDELIVLLCEAAIHERLLELGEGSPGISGLPLSATNFEWVDLEGAQALFAGVGQVVSNETVQGEALVALVHTLIDLRGWMAREPEVFGELASQAVVRFEEFPHGAVREACRRLKNGIGTDIDVMKLRGSGENLVGLDSLRQLLTLDSRQAEDALYELWLEGPLLRTPAVWAALAIEPDED